MVGREVLVQSEQVLEEPLPVVSIPASLLGTTAAHYAVADTQVKASMQYWAKAAQRFFALEAADQAAVVGFVQAERVLGLQADLAS